MTDTDSLRGTVMVITGSTSGIGRATAEALAAKGATVVVHGRDATEGERVRAEIAAGAPRADVRLETADLSTQAGVRALASALNRLDRLDVLINNAGLDVGQRHVTADGVELTFAVNVLAPFLLTAQVRDLLHASAPARILNVASSGYHGGTIDLDDLQGAEQQHFSGQKTYDNAKLALVLLTGELARRLGGTGVTANCVDPGFVKGTELGSTLPLPLKVLGSLMSPFMASPAKGARTAVWAASAPELATVTGQYFKGCTPVTTEPKARDEAVAARLWDAVDALVAPHP